MELFLWLYIIPLIGGLVMETDIGGWRNISALPFIPVINIIWLFALAFMGGH